jgi:hypothetical protein
MNVFQIMEVRRFSAPHFPLIRERRLAAMKTRAAAAAHLAQLIHYGRSSVLRADPDPAGRGIDD